MDKLIDLLLASSYIIAVFQGGVPTECISRGGHIAGILMGVNNHWTTNYWTGLDWNPKICFYVQRYAIKM